MIPSLCGFLIGVAGGLSPAPQGRVAPRPAQRGELVAAPAASTAVLAALVPRRNVILLRLGCDSESLSEVVCLGKSFELVAALATQIVNERNDVLAT